MKKQTLYEDLNISKKATQAEVKRAFREQAFLHHPDTNPEDKGEQFSRISQAYKVLSDPEQRELYDETGAISRPMNDVSIATDKLCQLILTIMEKKSIENLLKTDLIQVMTNILNDGIKQIKKGVVDATKKQKDLQKLSNKFTTNNGTPNFFKILLDEQVSFMSRNLLNLKGELKSCEIQKKLLKDCNFAQDKQQEEIMRYFSVGNFGATTSTASW